MSARSGNPLLARFRALMLGRASRSEFYQLKQEAMAAGDADIETLCLGQLGILETDPRQKLLIRREYASRAQSGLAYAALGTAERDAGNLRAARTAFERALDLLPREPKTKETRKRVETSLLELEAAANGDREPVERRIATHSAILAIHRARTENTERELRHVKRLFNSAIRRQSVVQARIYFAALETISSLTGRSDRLADCKSALAALEVQRRRSSESE